MNRYMMDEYHRDPALLHRRLTAEAHRQRSIAIGEAIASLFGGIGRVFGYVKTRLSARPGHWIARLG